VLKTLGRPGVSELIIRCCAHARQMARLLGAHPRVTILNDVVLNHVLVRFNDRSGSNITPQVIAAVQKEGVCWVGGTSWNREPAMRISISNWSTTSNDIERSAAAILAATEHHC